MSEEGATRRSTRSLTRRQSTETPSPPPLGGTPAKRARSARVALLSSIAETGSASNVVKAVDENVENNQDSAKQRSSSLTTVDSPKPKRGGRRSLLTEDAVASLEPVRRSRRLSTSSEVSVDVTEEASRSSTPVKGVTRRTRRLSVDSEDSSNAPTTRAHTVSALPVVEAIQEEELNILSSNDFSNSSKNTSIVGQFAVTSETSDDDVIIIEPESFGPSDKEAKSNTTSINSKLSPKLSISDNSNTVCKSFIVKSSLDPTPDTSPKTSQLKQTEKDISSEQAKNLPPVEQLKSKTPTSSCEIEITVTDPTNRTKSLTDVADLDEPVFNNTSPVAQLKSTKACNVHIARVDISEVNGKITEANNSGNQKLGYSNENQEVGDAAIVKETISEKLSDKVVLTEFQNNVDGNSSDCGSTLQLTIDTSSSLIADSNISDNVEKDGETSLNTIEETVLSLTSEQEHNTSHEEEKIHKSPKSAKKLHPQTLSNNDKPDESLHQHSPCEGNLSVNSDKVLDKSLSASVEQITKEEQNIVSEKQTDLLTKEQNDYSPQTEEASISEKEQNEPVTLENDLNISGKKINEIFDANTSVAEKVELNSFDVSMQEISEENSTKTTEEKLNTSAISEKDLNAPNAEKELNASIVSEKGLHMSAVLEKELNASPVSKKELNTSATSEKELNAPAITEKELHAPAVSEKEFNESVVSEKGLDTSAVSEKELNASPISKKQLIESATSGKELDVSAVSGKELNASAVSEKELNASTASDKELNASAISGKELNASAVSEKELNASAISEKELNASTASDKELNASAISEKDLNASAVSEKELNASTASDKELNASAVSEKELNASTASGKELNASAISEKELNASAVSEKELNAPAVSEKELNVSAVSKKELNASAVSKKELNASAVSEKELNASAVSEKELNASTASDKELNASTISEKEGNVSTLSEKFQNISSHDEELNVSSEAIQQLTNSTEQLNVSNVTKNLNLSAGCDKLLNTSVDSKNEMEISNEKLEDEELLVSTSTEIKNKTEVSTPEKLNKSQKLVEDKETSSLVISDDSDIESESNAKEYLKLNSDSDSSDYVDKEAKDMGKNYESHDSMDDEERDAERENKFLEVGESIESSDNEELDDDYQHDSFCVESRSEDEELLEGDSEDLDSRSSSGLSDLSQSQAAKEKYNSRRSKKRMSVILDSSSDMLEDGKDITLRIESDDENESENVPKDMGSKIPAKDLPKTLSEAVEELKQLKNIPQSESGSSDISEDINIKNQYQEVLNELNSQHQKEESIEKDLDTSKGTLKKTTSPKSLNESNSIQIKEQSPSKNSIIDSPTKTAIDNNETDQLNSNASVESKSSSLLTNDISNKETNKPPVDSNKETICIDESEPESADLKSNTSENIQGPSGLQNGKSKNPMKSKLKEQNKIDFNKIDLNKIQAACEQIMQKEIEKKRIRRESENESNTKKQTKALRGESTKKLKRLPEATLKELDDIESTSEAVTKLGKDIKEKTQAVNKQEKNIKESKTSPSNLKRLPEKTLDELMDSEDEIVEEVLAKSTEKEINVQAKKTTVAKPTKVFNNVALKEKEHKISAQSKKALTGTTLSEISNTNKKSNKAPIKKKFKQQENIPKATTYFEVTSVKNEKKRTLPPPAGTGFQVKRIKTKTVETSVEGCTTIFKIESRKKINLKDVLSTVVSNETTNFKQNSLTNSKIQRIEKGLIEARKNKQKALASRK